MGKVLGLQCRECGANYPAQPTHICEFCFGPLEVSYDHAALAGRISRRSIARGPLSMWRYAELLPLDGEPTVGRQVGFTPLVKAEGLGEALGHRNLYLKNDSVNHPTLSFKDRVVAVALSKAREFGFHTVACASTGNLANSVAAQAAEGKFRCFIFIPADLEQGKVLGTLIYGAQVVAVDGSYDDVNRLCSEAAGSYPWAFANINIRAYYAEGSKTVGFEIAEQLGWQAPQHIVVPCAGGSLITKIHKGLGELKTLGLIGGAPTKMHAAQASGCAPITTAIKEGSAVIKPVRPRTIAKSIAIGNPADGYYAVDTVRQSGGHGWDVSDEETVGCIRLLAETEGIFTETAGGVTVAAARALIAQGRIPRDELTVLAITGNGLKTQEAVAAGLPQPIRIRPSLAALEEAFAGLSIHKGE